MPRKSVEPPNATATKKQKPPGGILQTRVPQTTNRRCWTAGIRNRLDSVSTVQLQHHNIYLTSLYYVDMYLSVYRSRINPGSPGIILKRRESAYSSIECPEIVLGRFGSEREKFRGSEIGNRKKNRHYITIS